MILSLIHISSKNAISYQLKSGAENNYNIIGEHVGTLTVTAQSITPDPQNPDSYKGAAIDEPSDHVYDGTEHKWAPEVTDKMCIRDRNYAAGQYAENEDGEWVAITRRPVKLTSKGDNKKYDGKPLTNDTVTVETKGEGTGFIDGEGVTIKVTGSQTDAGESDNTFDYIFTQ